MKYEKTTSVRYCPICRNVGEFLSDGDTSFVRCPVCKSLARQRFQWLYLEQWLAKRAAGARMLQVAPEPCFIPHFKELFGEANYVTADLKKGGFGGRVVSLTETGFEDDAFDFLLCGVLGEQKDPPRALAEIRRILHNDGTAFLTLSSPELIDRVKGAFSTVLPISVGEIIYNRNLVDFLALDQSDTLYLAGK